MEDTTIQEAIKYFTDENERYENMIGDMVNYIEEYRMNLLAIEALKDKLKNEAHLAAGL